MYYLCSENKGSDQLRSYCEADLHLCFRLCRLLVFILLCKISLFCSISYKKNFMFNSAEHGIYPALDCQNVNNFAVFKQDKLPVLAILT